MNSFSARGTGAALIAAVLAACSSSPTARPTTQPTPSAAPVSQSAAVTPTPTGAAPASAVAQARADSARHPYTKADIAFMSGMIHHHAQAIVMARMAPSHGASESVRTLCERIINAQQDEIRTMQNWLLDRGQPVPAATPGGMKMEMDGMEHEMLMPGMLSEEQMKELDAARGTDFDRLFLKYMIQHHTGATKMVQDLFATYGAAQDETTFKLASDINVDQTTEIARMQRMLFALTLETGGASQ